MVRLYVALNALGSSRIFGNFAARWRGGKSYGHRVRLKLLLGTLAWPLQEKWVCFRQLVRLLASAADARVADGAVRVRDSC
jgi:hypothetical protein